MHPLKLSIKTREKVLFQGDVKYVSSINEKGKFDILPFHANFISMITGTVTVTNLDNTKKDFSLKTGIMRVFSDSVSVFVD